MANDPLDTPHTLTVSFQCASAVAAYETLDTVVRVLRVDQNVTSDDFEEDDNTIIPPGTGIALMTRSTTNPVQVGSAIVKLTLG